MLPKTKTYKRPKICKGNPLKIRLHVWDYTHRYQMLGKNRQWIEVASLTDARHYASNNGYSGIKITPI